MPTVSPPPQPVLPPPIPRVLPKLPCKELPPPLPPPRPPELPPPPRPNGMLVVTVVVVVAAGVCVALVDVTAVSLRFCLESDIITDVGLSDAENRTNRERGGDKMIKPHELMSHPANKVFGILSKKS